MEELFREDLILLAKLSLLHDILPTGLAVLKNLPTSVFDHLLAKQALQLLLLRKRERLYTLYELCEVSTHEDLLKPNAARILSVLTAFKSYLMQTSTNAITSSTTPTGFLNEFRLAGTIVN